MLHAVQPKLSGRPGDLIQVPGVIMPGETLALALILQNPAGQRPINVCSVTKVARPVPAFTEIYIMKNEPPSPDEFCEGVHG